MALVIADRVKETTTTTGTGTLNLAGTTSGFRTFVAGVGTGNTTYYCITSGTDWEVGLGTVTSGTPDTLSRTTILASSNSGSAISLSGTSSVFGDAPAALVGSGGLFGPITSKPVPAKTATGFTNVMGTGSPTATDTPVGILFTTANASGGFMYMTPPATPYTYDMLLTAGPESGVVPFAGWSDGTKLMVGYAPKLLDSGYGTVIVIAYNSIGSFNSTLATSTNRGAHGDQFWCRLVNDGTNAQWWFSTDGNYWGTTPIYTVTLASSFLGASGFTRLVVGNNAAASVTLASFTRTT